MNIKTQYVSQVGGYYEVLLYSIFTYDHKSQGFHAVKLRVGQSNIYPINIYEPWQQTLAIFIPHEYLPIQVHNSLIFILVPTNMTDYRYLE